VATQEWQMQKRHRQRTIATSEPTLRSCLFALALFHAVAGNAAAQPLRASTPETPATKAGSEHWSVAASAYTYVVPNATNYVQPTLTADRGWLHLEGRLNYEAIDTASAWVGTNFGGGERLTWTLTPMFGAVFGDIYGVAPAYRGSLGWRPFELYSEGEYVLDGGGAADNFLYNWSEATFAPIETFWFGVATQRTRTYQTDRDIQRGLLAGFSYRRTQVIGYVFNPDDDAPTVVIAVRVTF
jgi:hypothetical protein